jgi:signal transduction histidine kinase
MHASKSSISSRANSAIRGYASNVIDGSYGAVPEYLFEPIGVMQESARLMASSIEDYLNISRIEQGRMKFEKSTFDVADLAGKVVNELGPIATKRGLDLTFKSVEPVMVNADIGKIKQVISNLADNAIKYTEKGSVSVTAEKVDGKARITIADTGVGIAADEIPKLFTKFTRARDANKVNTTGTGLGLYVAKQLVEGNGGAIRIESDGVGKGSRFIIELPL